MEQSTSRGVKRKRELNWSLCFLCQTAKKERVQKCTKIGLISINQKLLKFQENDALPSNIDLDELDEGRGMVDTCLFHDAVIHKTCRSLCDQQKLKRLLNRQSEDSKDTPKEALQCKKSKLVIKKLRSSQPHTLSGEPSCIICSGERSGNLTQVKSQETGQKIKKWAQNQNLYELEMRLPINDDLVAAAAFYHLACYVKLQRAADSPIERKSCEEVDDQCFNPLVIAQIVVHMNDSKSSSFKLSFLKDVYRARMNELGQPCIGNELHSTRFKKHILRYLPDWHEVAQGREVILSHRTTIFKVANETLGHYSLDQDQALVLMRASKILRAQILSAEQTKFIGSFSTQCLSKPVPDSLLTFMTILLQGTANVMVSEVTSDTDEGMASRKQIACCLSQLLIFNTVTRGRSTTNIRHPAKMETPFPLYVGVKLHAEGRSKQQLEMLLEYGLSIGPKRVRGIKLGLARAVCKRAKEESVLVPTNMKKGVFVTGDVDNLDHRKTSNLSNKEFHGTAITMTNHLSVENMGVGRDPIVIDHSDTSKPQLPDEYSQIPHVDLGNDAQYCRSEHAYAITPLNDIIHEAQMQEELWISHVQNAINKDGFEPGDTPIMWSGYSSYHLDDDSIKPTAVIGTLPLFSLKASSPSMIKHAMELLKKNTEFLNPGQTPVMGMDQPLYAIGKQLQWIYPDTLGEGSYFLKLGDLHIEDKWQLMMGKYLRSSGWDWCVADAGVFSSGRASSALDEHHIKRTRYIHQVSLVAYSIMRKDAYAKHPQAPNGPPITFENWCNEQASKSPNFKYWSTLLDMELIYCRFLRAIREGRFLLYREVLNEMCPWFFAFDHINYARWVPVHIRDLMQLEDTHPDVFHEFVEGNFGVQRSQHKFSLIGKDQSHEQSNKTLQSSGGLSDLYDDQETLAVYMLSTPDSLRIVDEFESVLTTPNKSTKHHEEAHSLQVKFFADVKSLVATLSKRENPFMNQGKCLVTLHTREVVDEEVTSSLCGAYEKGKRAHDDFVEARLVECSLPINSPIKKLNVYTFENRPMVKKTKVQKSAKYNASLTVRLFMSLQARPDIDPTEFYKYENHREPPALCDNGLMRSGNKSDILKCLNVPKTRSDSTKNATLMVADMPGVVHAVGPAQACTFKDYVSMNLVSYLREFTTNSLREMRLMWDDYPEYSLKIQAHVKRGTGPRTLLEDGSTSIPKGDWQGYLSNTENKKEFFLFAGEQLLQSDLPVLLITTKGDTVEANRDCDLSGLTKCNHAEADTKIILHLADGFAKGHICVYVRTVDSDVVVLCISFYHTFPFQELWVGFGVGRNYRDIPIHTIANQLGPAKSLALSLFHALSGCDTTSQLYGCGKKTAWQAWEALPELTGVLLELRQSPDKLTIESPQMRCLDRVFVLQYSRTCDASSVNQARQILFTKGLRSFESLPPTQCALFQHIKRSLLQACFYWKQATVSVQHIPDVSKWGWQFVESRKEWCPFWTHLDDVSTASRILLRCGCKKACRGNCKCSRADIRCSYLCACENGCENNDGE